MKKKLMSLYMILLSLFPTLTFAKDVSGSVADEETQGELARQWGVRYFDGTVYVNPPDDGTKIYGLGVNSAADQIQNVSNGLINFSNYLFVAGYIIIVGFIVYSGIMMASAVGNPRKKEGARSTLIKALIAIALLGGLQLIINIAFNFFA